MADHVHGCLSCRPDMVPDFDRADPRYHDGEKCGRLLSVTLDGNPTGYTAGVFEGDEGWILQASETLDASLVHPCPNCTTYTAYEGERFVDRWEPCVEPRFGRVAVVHECPAVARDRERRIRERG